MPNLIAGSCYKIKRIFNLLTLYLHTTLIKQPGTFSVRLFIFKISVRYANPPATYIFLYLCSIHIEVRQHTPNNFNHKPLLSEWPWLRCQYTSWIEFTTQVKDEKQTYQNLLEEYQIKKFFCYLSYPRYTGSADFAMLYQSAEFQLCLQTKPQPARKVNIK